MAKTNKILVPEAKEKLEKLKLEVAESVGIPNYKDVDKGKLTARENGTVGGNVVKKMVQEYEKNL